MRQVLMSFLIAAGTTASFATAQAPENPTPLPETAADTEARTPREASRRPPLGRMFEQADADADGKVSLEELKQAAPQFPQEAFSRMDQNKDGFLTREEIRTGRREVADEERPGPARERQAGTLQQILQRADANQDRRITREEFESGFPNAPSERFQALDRNGDGVIDRQDRAPQGEAPQQPPARRDPREFLRRADSNGDGKVTREEFVLAMANAAPARFDALDRNKDGVLTEADFAAGPPRRPRPPRTDAGGGL